MLSLCAVYVNVYLACYDERTSVASVAFTLNMMGRYRVHGGCDPKTVWVHHSASAELTLSRDSSHTNCRLWL